MYSKKKQTLYIMRFNSNFSSFVNKMYIIFNMLWKERNVLFSQQKERLIYYIVFLKCFVKIYYKLFNFFSILFLYRTFLLSASQISKNKLGYFIHERLLYFYFYKSFYAFLKVTIQKNYARTVYFQEKHIFYQIINSFYN